MSDIEINLFEVIVGESFPLGRAIKAVKRSVLITRDKTTFIVFTKDDPGTEILFRN